MKRHMERLMVLRRGVSTAACTLLFTGTLVYADGPGAAGSGGMSPMVILFIVFVGAIVLLQLAPALVLFSSLVAAVFKRTSRKAGAASGE